MKKTNKIMMAAVSILLSLVLISTSLVSGIFARFVIEKEVGVPIKFKAFGVTLTVSGTKEFTTVSNGNSATITFNNFEMYPGSACADAIRFVFDGKTTVATKLTVGVKLEIDPKFVVPANTVIKDDKIVYMPLEFKVGYFTDKDNLTTTNVLPTKSNRYLETSSSKTNQELADSAENEVKEVIRDKISSTMASTSETKGIDNGLYYVSGTFNAESENFFSNSSKGISFGFEWKERMSTATNNYTSDDSMKNAIEAYLGNTFKDGTVPMTFTITVKLEQS